MKATDLMIGDWVNAQYYVDRDFVKQISVYDLQRAGDYDIFKPLDLTAEILEKNGFGAENILGDRSSVPQLLQVFDDNYIVMYQKYFKYIHELQHALRLCGLHDLANNFKI